MQIVGYRLNRADGSLSDSAIQAKALELRRRLTEILRVRDPFFMIGAYDPAEEAYWVGVEVEGADEAPEGMAAVVIPAGKYAVKWHYGKRSDVSVTYRRMDELLEQADIARNDRGWRIEMTRNWGSKAEHDELEMDLYVPIE